MGIAPTCNQCWMVSHRTDYTSRTQHRISSAELASDEPRLVRVIKAALPKVDHQRESINTITGSPQECNLVHTAWFRSHTAWVRSHTAWFSFLQITLGGLDWVVQSTQVHRRSAHRRSATQFLWPIRARTTIDSLLTWFLYVGAQCHGFTVEVQLKAVSQC